ncbi:FecCD family ABC transporter permease [Helicobacter trogontum]|uniref:Iron ABC transporter permease n=1 Tax=Helicobacter trogontum TaxID=50960 RepID=A0A4V6HZ43_9HELI|nr:iron ABC transporter permease [Helicobacter trogontum]TLD83032.1 iron ABC transporter permease [Helicobacter trogontum]
MRHTALSYTSIFYVIILLLYIVLIYAGLMINGDSIELVKFGDVSNDSLLRQIIFEIRMPRIVMAILIGMLLASSGAVTQTIFSNPIADPYIMGIASAATFGAVLAYMLKLPDLYFGVVGFFCCVCFAMLIFRISRRLSIATLLIIGIAISSFLGAITSFGMYYIGEDSFKITAWLMGYLGLASWYKVAILCIPLMICLVYFYLYRHELNIILSGDDEARNLGVDSMKLKRNMLIAVSLGVAFGVTFSGLIGFVGLIIPHIVRLCIKNFDNALVIPLSTLLGGAFLLFSDLLARLVLAPVEIPIGVVTAIFGSPVFLYLALQSRRFL